MVLESIIATVAGVAWLTNETSTILGNWDKIGGQTWGKKFDELDQQRQCLVNAIKSKYNDYSNAQNITNVARDSFQRAEESELHRASISKTQNSLPKLEEEVNSLLQVNAALLNDWRETFPACRGHYTESSYYTTVVAPYTR
jgi:hypothetical protein